MVDLERILRGSLVERYKRCGKPGCHCAAGKGHGPAWYLSVTIGPGQTRSHYVSASQRKVVARYLRNYQQLREVVEAIVTTNRQLLEQRALDED